MLSYCVEETVGFDIKASFVSQNHFKKRSLVPRDFSGIENFKVNKRSMVRIERVWHHFERYHR